MSIPKIIHYCWFGDKPLPNMAIKCIRSWKKYCPDYEIRCWNEKNFDINVCPYVAEAYEEKAWAFVSDYARLWIIYNYGGIYLDTDVELLKNIDNLLKYDVFMGFENTQYVNTGVGFGSCPRSGVIKAMLEEYDNIHFKDDNGREDRLPCPERNTKALLKYSLVQNGKTQLLRENVLVLAPEFMSPIDYESTEMHKTQNTISIHHFSASWHTEDQKKARLWKIYLRRQKRLGEKFGNRVFWLYGVWLTFRMLGIKWLANRIKSKLLKKVEEEKDV